MFRSSLLCVTFWILQVQDLILQFYFYHINSVLLIGLTHLYGNAYRASCIYFNLAVEQRRPGFVQKLSSCHLWSLAAGNCRDGLRCRQSGGWQGRTEAPTQGLPRWTRGKLYERNQAFHLTPLQLLSLCLDFITEVDCVKFLSCMPILFNFLLQMVGKTLLYR